MTSSLNDFVKTMISTAGLSGYETPIREQIEKTWEPLTDKMTVSPIGSLFDRHRPQAHARDSIPTG